MDDFPSDIEVRGLHKTLTVHLGWIGISERFLDLVL